MNMPGYNIDNPPAGFEILGAGSPTTPVYVQVPIHAIRNWMQSSGGERTPADGDSKCRRSLAPLPRSWSLFALLTEKKQSSPALLNQVICVSKKSATWPD